MIVKRFKSEEEKSQLISHVASKEGTARGFYLTPHMRKNYFYPLTDPRCIPADEATHMLDTDHVVGVCHKGKARAYPQFIMDYYHHLNDIIGGDPLVLCT